MSINRIRRRLLHAGAASVASFSLPFAFETRSFAAQGGVLSVAIPSNPQTLDPLNQPNHDVMAINQLIFENLVGIDARGQRVPQLARAWNISPDKLTYTFDLQPGVYFQNGQPFTSADVKYSFDYVLDPAHKAFRRPFWTVIDSVSGPNPQTVVIRLKRPYRPLLDYMAKYMGIFPAGSREQHPADFFRRTPAGVGTGPGIFVQARANDFVELRRNPTYWRKGLPHWERVIFRIIPEESSRLASLMAMQTQIISAPPAQIFPQIRRAPGVTGDSRPSPTSPLMMCLNTRKAPFDDPSFRRAVSLVIDRAKICRDLCYGAVSASSMPFASNSPWYDAASATRADFNLDAARAALKASKYANGAQFDLLYVQPAYLIDTSSTALFIQAQLASIGVRVNLRPLDFGQMISQAMVGNHQAVLSGFIAPPEPTYLLNALFRSTESLWKATGYSNPEFLTLIDESYAADDPDSLKQILAKVQHIVARDCPAIWIGALDVQNLWRTQVKDFEVSTGFSLALGPVAVSNI
ncbi:ABC transporter substrate-binding protein [Paraburkholderia sp. 22B1P]|uniref:ABC transporter substrate-binding protein n=1 Tax=Paraburkholderia sp. 22B1P TaxID=3080498 RepID=UPI00308DC02E|nr:ABC transporter substrate-binding protein [Paraburkholderia sp. 22B1P]